MKTKSIQSIKGTQDILPDEVHFWQAMERKIFEEMVFFGFSEIRTPAFENTDLFSRSVGEDSKWGIRKGIHPGKPGWSSDNDFKEKTDGRASNRTSRSEIT